MSHFHMRTVAVNVSGTFLEGLRDIHPVIQLTSQLFVSVFVSLIQNYVWTQFSAFFQTRDQLHSGRYAEPIPRQYRPRFGYDAASRFTLI